MVRKLQPRANWMSQGRTTGFPLPVLHCRQHMESSFPSVRKWIRNSFDQSDYILRKCAPKGELIRRKFSSAPQLLPLVPSELGTGNRVFRRF
ncbi:hypothetical protein Y032_0008g320 [Ancylostoma ceylanicum]|uniref:Uncharacterized protein n=1 Tax=Ancylostoma ceylanicum TaxID=53326 RepID=A0A016VL05_9BILA|nr:hypothetical protein Y032_0008g320 [Ancylostoma ceylanicum]